MPADASSPIRDRYVNVETPPASTFVVVNRLMRPGWLIEIEAGCRDRLTREIEMTVGRYDGFGLNQSG